MAKIYSFMPRPAAATRRESASRGAATIIIFPGIRYERGRAGGGDAGSGGAGTAGRKSARKRG